MESISCEDCQKFIEQLNAHLAGTPGAPVGYRFSLPTESQWEYACRAGTTTKYHFGDTLTSNQANFNSNLKKTSEVGSYPANTWGLFDMHGNVWEWCSDWYGTYPSDAVTDPKGASSGSNRVLRGGGWFSLAEDCRSARQNVLGTSNRHGDCGVRLALVRAE